MTVPALRGANLYALLRPIAAEARIRCQARRARLGGAASECANAKDFVALSESCAFEAHRTFVRQLRIPFNWDTHRKAVVERARAMLVAELEGGKTNYGEWRCASRTGGVVSRVPRLGRRGGGASRRTTTAGPSAPKRTCSPFVGERTGSPRASSPTGSARP